MAWRDKEGWLNFVFLGDGIVEDENERDGVIHHEKLGLREFGVRVNLLSPICQVRVPIRSVITPIWGLPNPIRQVVPLISHIRSYPPHRSDFHPPSLSFSSTTLLSLQNTKLSHPSLSLHAMIMSWHRVQHTPSKASTQDCLSSFHSQDYEWTPECSFSFQCASLHDQPPSATAPWELKDIVTLAHSHVCESTNWGIESQHPARHPSTSSKYSSKLAWLRPPSSHNHGLQVHLQTRSITASKCISKLAQSWPPSVCPNSLDYGLRSHTIMVSKCIYKLAWSRYRSAFLSSLHHGLKVYLQTHSITPSMFARSLCPSASNYSLDRDLGVNL